MNRRDLYVVMGRRAPSILVRFLLAASALLAAAGATEALAQVSRGVALAPGDKAPLLRGRDLVTGESRLVEWPGSRLTLVNFWATWCVPCQEEMPALHRLWTDRRDDGLAVVGVNMQDLPAVEIQTFVHTFGAGYPILLAPGRTSGEWGGIGALPASFLVDSGGVILRRYIGATPEQIEGLVADVDAVLAGRQMGPLVIPDTTNAVTGAEATDEAGDGDGAANEAGEDGNGGPSPAP